ncbi:MAG TPA: CoA transferase [Symbiobacteriaceae bacterium]|jgi:crotonobetainyl-CoA:carnitine CoA-transferase CaiB-like acyl-CoA transferase
MTTVTNQRALDGLRVLDLSRVLAGPFCCMMLGDHGAEVIKVEPPTGDETRGYGPPFVNGEATYFMNINRNKRGIVLDLAGEAGRAVVRRLVQSSDVLVENFKTGTMEKWGLGYAELQAINPRLIYCGISGYGRTGPYAGVAGYDAALQAMGGLMSINGELGGEPTKTGIAFADLTTGMFAAQAILLALQHRNRTGLGQQVEVSLLETVVALMHPHNSNYLNAGVIGKPHGNSHPMISPYDLVDTADRPLYLPSGNDGQVKRLGEVIGRPDLADDPRFRTNRDRVAHRAELLAIVAGVFQTKPAMEWCRLLWAAGVPAGPVNSVDEVFADPQVLHREMVQEIPHPKLGTLKMPGLPVKLHGSPGAIRRPPPLMGQHTVKVLRELGYTEAEIRQMLDAGVATQGEVESDAVALP